ncbi:hypothetical protein ACFQL0_21830 [Haloplanus litoreus]
MTRKSERELESAVTDLEPHSNDAPGFRYVVAFEEPTATCTRRRVARRRPTSKRPQPSFSGPRTMTRKSERELERALETLDDDADGNRIQVLFRDDRTDGLVDGDGEPADPDPGADTIIVNESVVMSRERAEAEGREILGPAEGEHVPDENDVVRVAKGRA